MNFTKENTLAEVVKGNFKTSEIFESYGLDYCCNGRRSIDDACKEKNINPDEILEKISTANKKKNGNGNFDKLELDSLIDFIVNTHHSYVEKMLPVIDAHSEKVFNAHGKNHPELLEIKNIWLSVSLELANHMMKEERMLFPYIKSLVNAKKNSSEYAYPPFGTVENPINMMEREHANAGDAFYRIKELTNNYSIPEDACATLTVFYKELQEFENDLHSHIHLENNILHPKAIILEKELSLKNK
ncbi:MAG: iron-sulfur cluster repair di-iron protein [Ignavibacteria bacterium]|jgi:regulator of cell morphogenesis and NO signaling